MRRVVRALFACALLWATTSAMPAVGAAPRLKAGLFLYAAPGLADPNFTNTVIVLLQHGPDGSVGLVVNRPMNRTLRDVFDEKLGGSGADVPLFWGGPVQPEALLALLRSPRPGPRGRTVLPEVQLTRDLDEVKAALWPHDAPLRVRVFSGYAGWGPGQLATEVRRGSWVLEPADAASVFTPEPSRLWRRVYEILGRVVVQRPDSGDDHAPRASSCRWRPRSGRSARRWMATSPSAPSPAGGRLT